MATATVTRKPLSQQLTDARTRATRCTSLYATMIGQDERGFSAKVISGSDPTIEYRIIYHDGHLTCPCAATIVCRHIGYLMNIGVPYVTNAKRPEDVPVTPNPNRPDPDEPEIGNAGRCGWCGRYDCICDDDPEPEPPESPSREEAEAAEFARQEALLAPLVTDPTVPPRCLGCGDFIAQAHPGQDFHDVACANRWLANGCPTPEPPAPASGQPLCCFCRQQPGTLQKSAGLFCSAECFGWYVSAKHELLANASYAADEAAEWEAFGVWLDAETAKLEAEAFCLTPAETALLEAVNGWYEQHVQPKSEKPIRPSAKLRRTLNRAERRTRKHALRAELATYRGDDFNAAYDRYLDLLPA